MKLLFDENLSPRLPALLASIYPGSRRVRECGLKGGPDDDIWVFARDNGFVLVSKDSDFYQRSMLHGHPPKLVWIHLGNCTRNQLVNLLTNRAADIHAMDASATESMIVVS
jgi:predicted nuclease of predicted toxin-antitoxin system